MYATFIRHILLTTTYLLPATRGKLTPVITLKTKVLDEVILLTSLFDPVVLTSCKQGLNNQTVCSICDDEPDLTPVKTVEIQNETVRNINIVARALIRIRLSKLTYRNQ